ncbi:uncharacterized protein K452DRAFT_293746 [Aplosporella prunicola CBS 121167]|uniref:PNPLA domain-containing protein n=1 Tax=Aplosporella prunicola CBS 121167 TaxID=1176127 RepID=A0A6A6BTI4_9PEZI|nr:uncharacterized protein K452DRAFT_293746 [Aplosporella prunicola CBS 121167]KAF2147300.1 hypothetical protein K452DRAFT_293746 [Aplosporella prunicola CBS 121167]
MQSPPNFDSSRPAHAPLRLLSLDGGGVRGLSSLMILGELMENIAQEEKRLGKRAINDDTLLKPCDYFDLIGGTSTGGIIAVLLGRLRQDVPSCIKIYTRLAKEIFKRDRSIHISGLKIPIGPTRFSGKVLESAIKRALRDLGYDENELMWDDSLFEEVVEPVSQGKENNIWTNSSRDLDSTNDPSHSLAVPDKKEAAKRDQPGINAGFAEGDASVTIRSPNDFSDLGSTTNISVNDSKAHWDKSTWRVHQDSSVRRKANRGGCRAFVVSALKNALGLPHILATYDPNDRTTRIWEALRATSAAPTFFEEMTFGTPHVTYLDGGMGYNNPCSEVDYAAKSIWEGRTIGMIASIGTGIQTIPSVKKIALWLPFGLGTDISLASALASMAMSTARVDNEMQRTYYGKDTRYFRFDVDGGLENISLEQWMKEDEMATLTNQYMRDPYQIRRARQFGKTMTKLSVLPPNFEIDALHFRVGINGRGIFDGEYMQKEVGFETDKSTESDASSPLENNNGPIVHRIQPRGRGNAIVDKDTGRFRQVRPVFLKPNINNEDREPAVLNCLRCENTCLRAIRTGIPPGIYKVKWIVSHQESEYSPPVNVIFSVGKPFDPTVYLDRFVDVRISPDIATVLLRPDAVRVRLGRRRYEAKKNKGWYEIEGDNLVEVDLEGALGFMINTKWEEDFVLGGWSFGGVRLEPVFEDPHGKI